MKRVPASQLVRRGSKARTGRSAPCGSERPEQAARRLEAPAVGDSEGAGSPAFSSDEILEVGAFISRSHQTCTSARAA